MTLEDEALEILTDGYGPEASFRPGQFEAIESVINRGKTLVVQKTGWGKSIVYFISTKILRRRGAGPTIIISPLLALMDNQIKSAKKIGINAVTINSENKEDWSDIYAHINNYDAIIISPERLANEIFLRELLKIENIRLFVVDEAHSISDWGHDFRPDYQRIIKIVREFSDEISILGTTATANDRVINDIKKQFGDNLKILRGDLMRNNIAIQVNGSKEPWEKIAWLTHNLKVDDRLNKGQGVIYCLTQKDCDRIADHLSREGINAVSYHSGLKEIAKKRLDDFEKGDVRILVSTIKLGMGYDKSDIRFIIHFQLPENLISYYQQIGRAGRDGENSYAILMYSESDEKILDFFIENAQTKPKTLENLLILAEGGKTKYELLDQINISDGKLNEAIQYLKINEYLRQEEKYYFTNKDKKFDIINERRKQENLIISRKQEKEKLKSFLVSSDCYMSIVASELDAPDNRDRCGICSNCISELIIDNEFGETDENNSKKFISEITGFSEVKIRKQWGNRKNIPENQQIKKIWVLSNDYYSEFGQLVSKGKYEDNFFSEIIVNEAVNVVYKKILEFGIDLVVPVPSLRRPSLVPDFANSLAKKSKVDFSNEVVCKDEIGAEQKQLLNSIQQQNNIQASISVNSNLVNGKNVLLVDDMVDSKWTFTVIAAELLKNGANSVCAFALVNTGHDF